MARSFTTDCEGFARRDFLKIGAAGLFGLSLPQLLQMEAKANETGERPTRRASSVIMVWLSGGPATIDMWDLRHNAPEGIRGEFREIDTSAAGIRTHDLGGAASTPGMSQSRASIERERQDGMRFSDRANKFFSANIQPP